MYRREFDKHTVDLFAEKGLEYFISKVALGNYNIINYAFSNHIQKDLGQWIPESRTSFSEIDEEQLKIAVDE